MCVRARGQEQRGRLAEDDRLLCEDNAAQAEDTFGRWGSGGVLSGVGKRFRCICLASCYRTVFEPVML